MAFFNLLTEARGSKEGRSAFTSKEGTKGRRRAGVVKSQKSRVKVYNSIMDALKHGQFGEIFSTTGSDRLYVITKRKWGHDPEQAVGSKVAKGFTPGSATPSADWDSIKKYSARTKMRHSRNREKRLKDKYASNLSLNVKPR